MSIIRIEVKLPRRPIPFAVEMYANGVRMTQRERKIYAAGFQDGRSSGSAEERLAKMLHRLEH